MSALPQKSRADITSGPGGQALPGPVHPKWGATHLAGVRGSLGSTWEESPVATRSWVWGRPGAETGHREALPQGAVLWWFQAAGWGGSRVRFTASSTTPGARLSMPHTPDPKQICQPHLRVDFWALAPRIQVKHPRLIPHPELAKDPGLHCRHFLPGPSRRSGSFFSHASLLPTSLFLPRRHLPVS